MRHYYFENVSLFIHSYKNVAWGNRTLISRTGILRDIHYTKATKNSTILVYLNLSEKTSRNSKGL